MQHQHRELVAEDGVGASLGSQSDGEGQGVAGAGAAELRAEAMEFAECGGGVELRVAKQAAELRGVGFCPGGLGGIKAFDATGQFRWC